MRTIHLITALLLVFSTQAQYLADNRPHDPAEEFYKGGEKAYRAGDYETAIELFTRAVDTDMRHANALLQRGFCYSLRKEYEKAIGDFTAVIELKPDHVWAYTSRGSAYAKLGRHTEAIADFDQVLALDARNAEALNNRGWSRKAQGDPAGACQDWKASKRMGNAEARIILENNRCK
ncbi:MAG: tetratricopeptide repeat protein [Flavobacteriales bacterium]|nr:tetratricopeptide repeat protein [Flavobacteriales bacterium]